ncbi:MAG TPA: hypothetical protein PKD32_11685 [Saprospiraceae bacterium]|nr:hypothetical protein [Saprospiraceae bacterium]
MKTQVNTHRGQRIALQIFAVYLPESVVSYTPLSLNETIPWNYNL